MKRRKIEIRKNVPLAPLTTFRIGGQAKFFAEVSAKEEFLEALEYAQKNNWAIFVMGGGSNILVSDEGFDGLVIRIKNHSSVGETRKSKIKIISQNSKILLKDVWAGDNLGSIVNFARDNALWGMEWASGIPGSIGGAIRGNAGAYGGEMKDVVNSVRILDLSGGFSDSDSQAQNLKLKMQSDSLKFEVFMNEDCKFDYRNSVFKEKNNLIVLSCVLELKKGNKEEIRKKMEEITAQRKIKLPGDSSAGSFFQNPIVKNKKLIAKFENDTGTKPCNGKLPAGWIIQEAGLRGKKIGGAMVSEKHANFVVNKGGATAQDVIILSSLIKQKIRMEFGVQMKEEIQYVGF